MKNILSVYFILALSGCAFMVVGDGMFVVSGDVSSYPDENCTCSILPENETVAASYNVRQIAKNFEQDFTVSPSPGSYRIEVACGGKVVAKRSIHYPKEVGPGGTVELGIIN